MGNLNKCSFPVQKTLVSKIEINNIVLRQGNPREAEQPEDGRFLIPGKVRDMVLD